MLDLEAYTWDLFPRPFPDLLSWTVKTAFSWQACKFWGGGDDATKMLTEFLREAIQSQASWCWLVRDWLHCQENPASAQIWIRGSKGEGRNWLGKKAQKSEWQTLSGAVFCNVPWMAWLLAVEVKSDGMLSIPWDWLSQIYFLSDRYGASALSHLNTSYIWLKITTFPHKTKKKCWTLSLLTWI